jgi:hypothetical protein
VLSHRGALLQRVASELMELAEQSSDPGLIASQLQQTEDMPPDVHLDNARAQLQARLDSLLSPHRAEITAQCDSSDIVGLDKCLAEHDVALASGDAVAALLREEWETVRQHRALVVEEVRDALRRLATRTTSFPGGGGEGCYAAVASALSTHASFAAALPEELSRCRSTLESLLREMKQALSAATAGDDVGTMDMLLDEVEREGFGLAVAAEVASLKRRRETVLARTLQQVEALQHSSDLSEISAVVHAAEEDGPGVHQIDQVRLLRDRARDLATGSDRTPIVGRGGSGGLELRWHR